MLNNFYLIQFLNDQMCVHVCLILVHLPCKLMWTKCEGQCEVKKHLANVKEMLDQPKETLSQRESNIGPTQDKRKLKFVVLHIVPTYI